MSRPYKFIPDSVVRDYAAGDSIMDISERYGCSPGGVLNYLRRNRVKMRPVGRPVKHGRGRKQKPWRAKPSTMLFRSGICACSGRGWFLLAGKKEKCPRCRG